MVPKLAILKIFKPHLLPNGKSDLAKTWLMALGRHGNLKLLKRFCYDTYDGRHSSHFEGLQLLTLLELCIRSAYAVDYVVDHGPSLVRMFVSNFTFLTSPSES